MAKKCTKSTKLIEFQFKFLHRRVPTNNVLFRISLQGDENCSFCHTSSESLVHLFSSCHQTSHFWNKVTEWLKSLNLLPRGYILTNIALGLRPDISHFELLINYCFLLAQYHIWLAKTKENQPNLVHFICTLINSSNWWWFCVEVLSRESHRKYTKGNGQLLVAGKRLILGVRGPGEKPSWGET